MKNKVLQFFPYALVGIIIIYLAVKYDAMNRGVVESDVEVKALEIETLVTHFSSFDTLEKINFVADEKVKFAGKSSALIAKDNLYGPTFSYDSISVIKKTKKVVVSFMVFSTMPVKDATVVISFSNEKENVIYKNARISENFKINDWNKVLIEFEIDNSILANESKIEFKAYVYNPKNEEVYIDDFKVQLLSLK